MRNLSSGQKYDLIFNDTPSTSSTMQKNRHMDRVTKATNQGRTFTLISKETWQAHVFYNLLPVKTIRREIEE